jgi:HEAT repeat protein
VRDIGDRVHHLRMRQLTDAMVHGRRCGYQFLAQCLDDRSARIRSLAALVCGRSGDQRYLPLVRDHLRDRAASVAASAARAIGFLNGRRYEQDLVELYLSTSSPAVKLALVHSLLEMGNRSALGYLNEIRRQHRLRYYQKRTVEELLSRFAETENTG